MKQLKSFTFILLAGLTLQACSFRSTQLDLLARIWEGPEEIPMEDLAWTLLWSGDTYTLYPVISDDGAMTFFTDLEGSIVIAHDGWQVVAADGLLPDMQNMQIVKTDEALEYLSNEQLISTHQCEEFASSRVNDNTIWIQDCTDGDNQPYENEIRVNGNGEITLLRFMIHPDYPTISLTADRLNF